MKISESTFYRCPICNQKLSLKIIEKSETEVIKGELYDNNNHKFSILDGIPRLISKEQMGKSDFSTQKEFDRRAETYDSDKEFMFKTFNEDAGKIRNSFADLLEVELGSTILEIGCGTGEDSENIIQRLSNASKYYLADLSISMINICKKKTFEKNPSVPTEFALVDGHYLPYPDESFDRTFHFGNIETFSQVELFFKEAARVTKKGGIVIMGGESVPIWLRDTNYGKILMNSNPLFEKHLPLEHIPKNAHNVSIHHFLGELFYIIKFKIGEDIHPLNLDVEFPSIRGGTHRTRYYGVLEGVTPKTKELVIQASKKAGKTQHKWLEDVLNEEVKKELSN